MRTEQFRQTAEVHRVEIRIQQCRVDACRLLRQVIGDGADGLLQRTDQLVGQLRLNLIGGDLCAVQFTPATQNALYVLFYVVWRYLP